MAALATLEDVEAVWRPLADDEWIQVDRLLTIASAVARSRVALIDERIAAGTLDADLVANVVASMAVRATKNPDGVRSTTVDDVAITFDTARTGGGVSITPEEIALLSPRSAPRVGTIRLGVWNHCR